MTVKSNSGSALISALFMMTLITIAAIAMSNRLQLDIYRTSTVIEQDKLYLASQAVTFWAMEKITEKNAFFTTEVPSGEVLQFPEKLSSLYPNIKLTGHIIDLQSRFNVNNLTDKKFQAYFYGLLENQILTMTSLERNALLKSIITWINPYYPDQGKNKLLNYYTKQNPPYWPSYQPLKDISELRLISGVNAEFLQQMQPILSVLPEVTTINLNTAPKALLKPLGNGLNDAQVEELFTARGSKGIRNLNLVRDLLQKLNISAEQISLESNYFLCVAEASTSESQLIVYTVLKREIKNKTKPKVRLLSERINSL